MTISIEAKREEQATEATDTLTLRLVDQAGKIVFNRAIPEDEAEARDLFSLALYATKLYRAGKRINGSGAI